MSTGADPGSGWVMGSPVSRGPSAPAILGVSARHLPGLPPVGGPPAELWGALRGLDVRSLELTVGREPEEAAFFRLAQEALAEGFGLSFHTPYPDALDLREFAGGRDPVGEFYRAWLSAVRRLPLPRRRPVLVVHGVNAPGTEVEVAAQARATTVAFLRWLVAACAERAVGMQFAFELRPRREGWTKVGSSCAEVLAVVEEVGLPDVGVCWDVGHGMVNLLRRDDGWPPPRAFLERTIHTHLHLATAEEDHFPIASAALRQAQGALSLSEAAAPFGEALVLLAREGYAGVLNLECHFTRWQEVVESAERVSQLWEEARASG